MVTLAANPWDCINNAPAFGVVISSLADSDNSDHLPVRKNQPPLSVKKAFSVYERWQNFCFQCFQVLKLSIQ